MTTSEIESISSEPVVLTLSSGLRVRVERLRTRQLMKLLKVVSTGAGPLLGSVDFQQDTESVLAELLGITILAVPEAEDEVINFVRSLLSPASLIQDPKTPQEQEANGNEMRLFQEETANPDLDDLVTIIETVYRVEGPHLASLGKRLSTLLNLQTRAAAQGTSKRRGGSRRSANASIQTAS